MTVPDADPAVIVRMTKGPTVVDRTTARVKNGSETEKRANASANWLAKHGSSNESAPARNANGNVRLANATARNVIAPATSAATSATARATSAGMSVARTADHGIVGDVALQ